jgi:hypothetical protein
MDGLLAKMMETIDLGPSNAAIHTPNDIHRL